MEYPDDCSTTIRRVVRKVAAMKDGLVWFGGDFTMGMYFQTGGLIYDSIPPLGLSLWSPIELIQSPIGFIWEFRDGT